jgi:NAD(P)-dependent dehydrogenase (short-subunit alcohol dehydrogenase family)
VIVTGKVFVVTGAGSGIGRDVVIALAGTGSRVPALDGLVNGRARRLPSPWLEQPLR